MTSRIEITPMSAKARKKPRFCLLLSVSLSFVRMHMNVSTKRSIVVKTKKLIYHKIKNTFCQNKRPIIRPDKNLFICPLLDIF